MKKLFLLLLIAGPLIVCTAQQGKKPADPVQGEHVLSVFGQEPETKAEFPGGAEELLRYIQENLEYPEKHMAERVEGRSFVRFIVREDGSVDDVHVARGCGPLFDAEAVRVVRNMPKWIPARKNGEAVSSSCAVFVRFVLD